MKELIKGAVFIAACLGVSSAALAQQDPKIGVTFNQLVPLEVGGIGKVSQSRPANNAGRSFLSQVTYRFQITNGGSSDLNRSFLNLTLGNPGGNEFPTVHDVVTTLPSATCTFTANVSITLNCQFGTLAANTGSVTAYVIVNVPSSGTVLEVNWTGGGFEGNGGNNGCCQPTGTYSTAMVDKLTDESYKFSLQTFVKKGGAVLFTGDQAIPAAAKRGQTADLNTTLALVPPISAAYPTDPLAIEKYAGNIFETSGSCGVGVTSSFKSDLCYDSLLSIPTLDFSKGGQYTEVSVDDDLGQTIAGAPDELLDVVLRVDGSALKNRVEAAAFKLFHDGVEVLACPTAQPATTRQQPPDALPPGTLVLPTAALPCFTSKTILQGAGIPNDLKGVLEIRAKHYRNGTWRIL